MNLIPYTQEITHCVGARKRLCTRCYRYLLMKRWQKTSDDEKKPIMLMGAKFASVSCPNFLDVHDVQAEFYQRNNNLTVNSLI